MKTSRSTKPKPSRLQRVLLSAGLIAVFGGMTGMLMLGISQLAPPVTYAAASSVQTASSATVPVLPSPKAVPAPSGNASSASPPAIAEPPLEKEQQAPLPPEQTDATPTGTENAPPAAVKMEKAEVPSPATPEREATGSLPTCLSWTPLITRLAADGFDAGELEPIFTSLKCPPLAEFMGQKAVELYGRYGKASLSLPGEEQGKFAPPDYTRIAGGMSVAAGRRTINNNVKFFEGLYKRYGVPAPFIVAVMMVETGLGAEVGKQSALLALGSMACTDSLDHVLPVVSGIDKNRGEMQDLIKARSDWAYNELKALLEYAKATQKDAAAIPGSVYGAIGICQFMPSNIPLFGVSSSKQRSVPDLFVLSDAAASVARYLSAHGWKKASTPAAQIAVLRSYNHNDVYASTVYGVASALMSPTTHRGAESARKGGNAVRAARENARASIPAGSKKAKPIEALPSYSDLLK